MIPTTFTGIVKAMVLNSRLVRTQKRTARSVGAGAVRTEELAQ
jgi:hypothetical protein